MRHTSILLVLGLIACAGAQTADQAAVPIPIHAGPVYTRGEQEGVYPKYPELQIQVDVPPATAPELRQAGAFSLKADNGSTANASSAQTLDSTHYGIAASIALDVSGSMKGKPLEAVRTGIRKFVGDAGPQDKVAIQTIADEGLWDADWGASPKQVQDTIDGLKPRGTLTRLWDGLLEAIGHFPATPLSQRLLVISDGHDEGSSHTEEEVIRAAREHGIVVDAVGVTRSNPIYLQGLDRLATETGGQFREAKDSAALQDLISSGIQRLKSTPVVRFRLADLPGDGKIHRLEVMWKHEGTESRAEVMAAIPLAAPAIESRRLWYWYWGGGIAAALLLLVMVIVIARMRSRRAGAKAGAVSGQKAQPVENGVGGVPPRPAPIPPRPVGAGENIAPPLRPGRLDIVDQSAPPVRSSTKMIARFPKPSKERPGVWLLCEEGYAVGKRFPVDEVEFWIGALENNHLRIADDPTLSGNHACLVFDHDVLGIYDYQSTNGTRVNGVLVGDTRHLLRPGDRIRVGRSTFVIEPAEEGGGL
jgi:Mg-chelatase subunit ChlD